MPSKIRSLSPPSDESVIETAPRVIIDKAIPRASGEDKADLRRYEAVLSASWDAVVCKATDGTITSWNPAATRLYGYADFEAIGQPISMLEPKALTGETAELLGRARLAPIEYLETVRLHKDGSEIPVALSVSPLVDEHGVLIGASTVTRDLTEATARSEQLRKEQRRTAEAARLFDHLYSTAPIGLGFIDRHFRTIRINDALALVSGLPADQLVGRMVKDAVPELWPQLEPTYRRVLETGQAVHNLDLEGPVASDPGRTHHWLASYYPVGLDAEILGIGIVVIDITERKLAELALSDLTTAAVGAMAATVEARDPSRAGHTHRVATLSAAIAARMGIGADEVEGIKLAAAIHEIGTIGIPSELLTQPRALSKVEFDLVKSHSTAGHDILAGIDFKWPVAQIIRQHHERLDGSGYPDGLKGDEILIGARIIAVADVVEAMTSRRSYRESEGGLTAALAEISIGRGKLYDARVADACLSLFTETGRGTLYDMGVADACLSLFTEDRVTVDASTS